MVSESGEVEKIRVNGNDGKYAAVVKVDQARKQDVLITVSKEGHSFDSQLVEKEKLNVKEVSVKVEPTPIVLLTSISPPMRRASDWEISRPRPVPP